MNPDKKQLLMEQVAKLNEVLDVLKNNFDVENEIPDEYSFLDIVKSQLTKFANE